MENSTIVQLSDLVGQHIVDIKGLHIDSTLIEIFTSEGNHYSFSHEQDCCEQVYLVDFESDLNHYNNTLVTSADVAESDTDADKDDGYSIWTFYKIQTNQGEIWLRFLCSSNGYYSTRIDFRKIIS